MGLHVHRNYQRAFPGPDVIFPAAVILMHVPVVRISHGFSVLLDVRVLRRSRLLSAFDLPKRMTAAKEQFHVNKWRVKIDF